MTGMRTISVLLRCSVMLCSGVVTSVALADNFQIDFDTVTLPPEGGRRTVHFVYSPTGAGTTAPTDFNVSLGPFSGDLGPVEIAIESQDCSTPGGKPEQSVLIRLPLTRIASACLVVGRMTAGAKYSGSLFIVSSNPSELKKSTINAVAATVPILSLDHQAETKPIKRPWWALFGFGYDSPADSVVIQEKSDKSTANGISARFDQGAKSPAGINQMNLFFKQGNQFPYLFITDPSRAIAPGNQTSYDIYVRNLVPGEYTIPLRFSGSNTGPDTPLTLLTLTVHVRDSIVWAILCLFMAMLLSFIVTKILTAQQRRLTMRQRIRDLEAKRTGDTNSPAAVFVNAMLHLADKLSCHNWLTGADLIDARINSTKAMIGLLNKVHDLRTQLSSKLSPIVRRRALVALDLLLSELNPSTGDDAKIQAVTAQLASLADWLSDDTFPKAFWTTIAPALLELQKQAAAWSNVPANAKVAVDALVARLKADTATPPTAAANVEDAYSNYVLLKLFFDHKDDAQVLGQLLQAQQDLEQCLHIADKADWDRVQASTLSIHMPEAPADGFEAYDPLSFSVTSSDPRAEHSYLFRHNVAFAWQFILSQEAKDQSAQAAPLVRLEPTAFGPWITQYFPQRGHVQVSVVLTYAGGTKKVDPAPGPTIGDTRDFGMFRAFAYIEYVSWGIAFLIALVTGLSTQYFKSGAFGSIQDYLLLFLWGVGADQGKNLLQALQAYSPSPPPATGN
jgi:hypothetical protein